MKHSGKPTEYIAYKGAKFAVEWYFDGAGRSQALEYADALDETHRIKMMKLFKLLGDMGTIKNTQKFRSEGDQVYAFKPQPHRFLCFFFKGAKVIVTNGFYKDQDKLPPNEKARAMRCKSDYEQRVKADTYYGKD